MREMTDEEISAKHLKVRGSQELKYVVEGRCFGLCGDNDQYEQGRPARQHRCFLKTGHGKECEFSTECYRTVIPF